MKVRRIARVVSFACLAASSLTSLRLAHAQGGIGEQCASAFENGQKQRDTGKLQAAEASFLVCAQKQCPGFIARDCSQFRDDVQKRIPSFVPAARSNGSDITAAKVSLDGVVVAERVDGRPIFADPGRHVVRFEDATGKSMDLPVVLAEGEKLRRVVAEFDADKVRGAGMLQPVGGQAIVVPDEPAAEGGRGALPWIVGGATLAAGGVALGFYLSARSEVGDLLATCAKNPNGCTESERSSALTKDTIALTLGIVAVVGAAATVLLFVLPSSPATQKTARYLTHGFTF